MTKNRSPHLSRRLALLSPLPLLSGCFLTKGGPTAVAQGKYFSAGHPDYDAFFIALYDIQVRLAEMPEERDRARRELAQGLGVSPDVPDDAVVQATKKRVDEISQRGRRTKLQIEASSPKSESPAASSAILLTRPSKRDEDTSALAKPLEESVNELLRVRDEARSIQEKLTPLDAQRIDLEARIDQTLRLESFTLRAEIRRNLEDAAKVLVLLKDRAERIEKDASSLVERLVVAVDTSQGAFDDTSPSPPVAHPAPKRAAKRKYRAPKGGTSAPKKAAPPQAAPTPPPPPASPGGFEP